MQRKERLKRGDPKRLVAHELSVQVFGEDPGSQLRESVRDHGVLEPIVVAADEITVVSGWRRRVASVAEGIGRVDIRVREDLVDPLDIEEAVLEYNARAPQTREIVARALAARQRIAIERAGKAKDGEAPSTTEITKQVAADAGESVMTTRRAIDVVNKEAALREQGKDKQADKLLETLNAEGFTQAKEHADKLIPPKRRASPKKAAASKPSGSSKASPKKKAGAAAPTGSTPKLNATDKKRLAKVKGHLNSISSQCPTAVFKEAETYIDLLRGIFDRYDRD